MVVTFEGTANISFEVEVVRHWELIPGEESPLEVRGATLSHKYSSALDLIR